MTGDDMTGDDMTDPIDRLRAANPVSPTPDAAQSPAARALFQEITMSDPTATIDSSASTPEPQRASSPFSPPPTAEQMAAAKAPRKLPRRGALTAAAAAAAAVIGVGAVSLIPGSTTPAAAAMLDAAQQTQAADSGTITVTLDVDADDDSGQFSLITDYDGDDLAARLAGSNEFGLGGEAPQLRVVDDVIYVNDGGQWFSVSDDRVMSLLTTFGLPTDVRQTMSAGVVELIELADDAEENADGSFTATVTVEEVRLVAEGFPSFALFADEALPEDVADQELQLDVVLDGNGLIDTVTLGADDLDEGDGTPVRADVTVDFDDLDAGAAIEAPADAEALDFSGVGDDEFDFTD